jgi:hypothetical protein
MVKTAKAGTPKLTLPVSSERDHVQGPDTAPVTLVEYGDYECPYCGQAYPILKNIQERLGNKLCFVFRNFPGCWFRLFLLYRYPAALIAPCCSTLKHRVYYTLISGRQHNAPSFTYQIRHYQYFCCPMLIG